MSSPIPFRVSFVCLGNICRSPTAHAIFQHLVDRAGLQADFAIESAGTGDWHVGGERDPRSREVGARRGVPLFGRAQQFGPDDFARFDRAFITVFKVSFSHLSILAWSFLVLGMRVPGERLVGPSLQTRRGLIREHRRAHALPRQVLAGDSWVPGLSELDENGDMDTGVVLFVCSFRLLVEWILLQAHIPAPDCRCPSLARIMILCDLKTLRARAQV